MYKLEASLGYEHIHLCYYRDCDIELTDFLFLLRFLIWLLMNNSKKKKKVTEQSQEGERMLMFQTLSPVKWKIKRREEVSSSSLGTCLHAMLDFIAQPQWPMWALFSVWGHIFASASSVWPSVGVSAMNPHVFACVLARGNHRRWHSVSCHTQESYRQKQCFSNLHRHQQTWGVLWNTEHSISVGWVGLSSELLASRILKDANVTGPWITSWEQVNLKPKVSSQNAEFA